MSTTIISTLEQLTALPVGTQVLDRDGMRLTKTADSTWTSKVTSARLLTGDEYPMTLGEDEISGAYTGRCAAAPGRTTDRPPSSP